MLLGKHLLSCKRDGDSWLHPFLYCLALNTDVLNCGNRLGTRGKGLENPRDTGLDINEPQNNHP